MKGRKSGKSAAAGSRGRRQAGNATNPAPASYTHPDADSPMRPEIGTQASFRKKKPPKTYKYDSTLSPEPEMVQAYRDTWELQDERLRLPD